MGRRKRRRVEPTDDWEQLELLCVWDEQREYERIRPLVLFGEPVPDRATETGTSERTLYRGIAGFEEGGMRSLFGSEPAKGRVLPASLRRLIEHPAHGGAVHAQVAGDALVRPPFVMQGDHSPPAFPGLRNLVVGLEAPERLDGQRLLLQDRTHGRQVRPPPGADVADPRDLVEVERGMFGLQVDKRWTEEGPNGLEDKKRGRSKGVQKVDLRAMLEVRRMQDNPELGAYRVRAALEQVGIFLGTRTVGRMLKANREAEGLPKPKRSPHTRREMPFEASFRHEYWTSDVRYINHSIPNTGQAYVVAVLENYSRAILASAVTLSQDTNAYLSVLHAAIGRHGSPGTIVTDGGGIFHTDRAKAVYRALGIEKVEIERGQAWQSFIETNFNLQRRLADHSFSKTETWEELVAEHDLWLERHNSQRHQAHEGREDGRRSPSEVLGPVRVVPHHPTDLSRAFFSTMLVRKLDASGYARVKHWRVYAEEGLARCEVAVWLGDGEMAVEYGGQTLSRYDVSLSRDAKLEAVTNPRLFANGHGTLQLKLFALDEALGEGGWLKALRLEGYAARSRGRPEALQQALFPYLEAL
jgi:putative transposase